MGLEVVSLAKTMSSVQERNSGKYTWWLERQTVLVSSIKFIFYELFYVSMFPRILFALKCGHMNPFGPTGIGQK